MPASGHRQRCFLPRCDPGEPDSTTLDSLRDGPVEMTGFGIEMGLPAVCCHTWGMALTVESVVLVLDVADTPPLDGICVEVDDLVETI